MLLKILKRLYLPIGIIAALWGIEFYEWVFNKSFVTWGILPRKLIGLRGIITSPFLHSDWGHLMSNTIPLFTLTTIMVFFYRRIAFSSFILIYLLTGLFVWLFARQSFIIGASGVVYGLVSFVFWSGVFRRDTVSIVLALIVLTVYASFFEGILPQKEGVSWESHLFGALIGIFVAFLFKNSKESRSVSTYDIGGSKETYTYFLPRDAFDYTMVERAAMEEARRQVEWQARMNQWYQSSTNINLENTDDKDVLK